MSKIRKLYYFDKKNTQEMISYLNNSANDTYINHIMFNPLILLHHLLPLRFKFLPESYVIKDKGEIKALITIAPITSYNRKMEIQKLFFEENSLDYAAELVQFAVSKYKAKGASSIVVKVDDYLTELLNMFVYKCGFAQISSEKLWRITKLPKAENKIINYRRFRNSDSGKISDMYNESLLPHFRPLLSLDKNDFKENIFGGLSYYSEYHYIIDDIRTGEPKMCISLRTSDNENYVIDTIQTGWENCDVVSVINFAYEQIHKRKKRFGLFLRTKKYTNTGEEIENQAKDAGLEGVQNLFVLTNSSAKVIKEPSVSSKYTVLNNFCTSGGFAI